MRRRVEITSEILDAIERSTGERLDSTSIVVYNAIAVTNHPMSKSGSIYDQAVLSLDTLRQMVDHVENNVEEVPLHTLHAQGFELPIGKVFSARLVDIEYGVSGVEVMFYLPSSDKEVIESIDLGIINEVSVGMVTSEARCSACGFDYMSDEADFMMWFDRTCPNGHVIGENGVHLQLNNLDSWMELSLVSRGASKGAKIRERRKELVNPVYSKLAASGKNTEPYFLLTSTKQENAMDEIEKLLKEMAETFKQSFDAMASKVETIEATVSELKASAEAETSEEDSPNQEDLEKFHESIKEVSEFSKSVSELKEIIETTKNLGVAVSSIEEDKELPEDVKADGNSKSNLKGTEEANNFQRFKSFKTKN